MNTFIEKLRQGKPQLGLCVMYPAPGIIERIGSDWDWIWIDGQHGQFGYQDILGMVRACNLIRRPAFVRVPSHERGFIGLMLDSGANGLIVPQVETVSDANSIVAASKFPPLGQRSYGGRRPIDMSGRNYSETAKKEVLIVAQIESPLAIENADSIAAVPGIDALFLGPDDIMMRRGFPMTVSHSKDILEKDMESVINACRKHNKMACMVGVAQEMLSLCTSMGFNMIVAGGDVPFLANSSKQASLAARNMLNNSNMLAQADVIVDSKSTSSPY